MNPDGVYPAISVILILFAGCCHLFASAALLYSGNEGKKDAPDLGAKTAPILKFARTQNLAKAFDICTTRLFLFVAGALLYLQTKPWLDSLQGIWGAVVPWAFLVLYVLVSCAGVILFCEAIASKDCGKAAAGTLWVYRLFYVLLFIPVKLLMLFMQGFTKLLGVDPILRDVVTEEEILMMVDEGGDAGLLEQSQKEMIEGIFELDDTTAEDIMTHRTDMQAVNREASLLDVISTSIASGHSRIPIYGEDADDIVGMIVVKDLLKLVGQSGTEDLLIDDFMRSVIYVPESIKSRDLLKTLIREHAQMAIVVDEYGGTAGLVSMEDILEEIVGNIQDEYDSEREEIRRQQDNSYIVEGSADLEDVAEELGLEIEYDDTLYDTVGGFITDHLGLIPEDGQTPQISYGGFDFSVLLVEDHRIVSVKITKSKKHADKQEKITKAEE